MRPATPRLWLLLFLGVSASLLLFADRAITFLWTPPSPLAVPHRVEIPEGASLRAAAALLQREGLLTNDAMFVLLGRWTRRDRIIMPGEYALHTRMLPMEILDLLVKGRVIEYEVVIPEGLTTEQIGRMLEEKRLVAGQRFLTLTRDPGLIRAVGVEAETLEGYLFPSTYHFTKRMGAEGIIRALVAAFHRAYTPALDRKSVV